MTDSNRIEYYRARAERESEMDELSSDENIARIHREMAKRYSQLVADSVDQPITLKLSL